MEEAACRFHTTPRWASARDDRHFRQATERQPLFECLVWRRELENSIRLVHLDLIPEA